MRTNEQSEAIGRIVGIIESLIDCKAIKPEYVERVQPHIDAMYRAFEMHHVHVAGTTVGKHIDTCAKCGRDIRENVHRTGFEGDLRQ